MRGLSDREREFLTLSDEIIDIAEDKSAAELAHALAEVRRVAEWRPWRRDAERLEPNELGKLALRVDAAARQAGVWPR
jgi:hypothetical protein